MEGETARFTITGSGAPAVVGRLTGTSPSGRQFAAVGPVSRADVAIIVLDARDGASAQVRSDVCTAWLGGTPRFVAAVDGTDLTREAFDGARRAFGGVARQFPGCEVHYVPLHGARWFDGATMLEYMESIPVDTLPPAAPAPVRRFRAMGWNIHTLDGDEVRQTICKGLGFSKEGRDENIRRIGFAAYLLAREGATVLVSAISPYRAVRDEARAMAANFIEVYVNAPLEICERRDVKGLYRRARAGEVKGVTGIDDPYEPPVSPEVECRTDRETVAESVEKILARLKAKAV